MDNACHLAEDFKSSMCIIGFKHTERGKTVFLGEMGSILPSPFDFKPLRGPKAVYSYKKWVLGIISQLLVDLGILISKCQIFGQISPDFTREAPHENLRSFLSYLGKSGESRGTPGFPKFEPITNRQFTLE